MKEYKKYKRIIVVVLDSLGIGNAPDAKEFDDEDTDTLGHLAEAYGGLKVINLQRLGLGNLHKTKGVRKTSKPKGVYTRMIERSVSKDTMTGHWEMMGLYINKPFNTFTETGFPKELIEELEEKTGYKVIGNVSASGTAIIEELGERHIETGEMIVYTSADSVLQIACSEESFGLDELYRCCEIAREITLKDEYKLGRVIARPFVGKKKGEFVRTSNRHDYALNPYGKTDLEYLSENGYDVISVGKIYNIFNTKGITEYQFSTSSVHGMEQTIEYLKRDFTGLLFTNLVDFDEKWGHRRDSIGYAKEIECFDQNLGKLIKKLNDDDLLILTADHGNDPTYKGSDHTRETVPMIAFSKSMERKGEIPQRNTFSDLGTTICDNFLCDHTENGESFLDYLK